MWVFAAAALSLSTAAYSQISSVPVTNAGTGTVTGVNTEPGYVPPPSSGTRAPNSAAGGTTSSTPGTLGTSQLGDGLDTNTAGSDLSRLFDPTLPPGVGTGTAAPGGSQNPKIPGR